MPTTFSFGPFQLEAEEQLLFRHGELVPLGRRAVGLLHVLVQNPGQVVSKDVLIDTAWSGLVVEESNLSVQIAALRRSMSVEKGADRWIETLARRGYRYIGPVVNKVDEAGELARTAPLALPDKPSIAVLPFDNLSDDPQQEYFAEGIVEDIIIALSRVRWLFVIARNSSLAYRDRAVDAKRIGVELGVRYILQGSVRKEEGRLRLSGQLIDAVSGVHLWADRFEGNLANVFDLQDRITESVVGAIGPRLEQAEIERVRLKPTDSLRAYDYYLRGLAGATLATKDGTRDALKFFYRAAELDPNYASAHAMAAWCYAWRQANGWMLDRAKETSEALRLARIATQIGRDDAVALARGGIVLAYTGGELEDAKAFLDAAIRLDPNQATAWHFGGWICVYLGEHERAIECQSRALRLSPFDPLRGNMFASIAYAHFFAGRFDASSAYARDAMREQPNFLAGFRVAAASNALTGRIGEAGAVMARLRAADPLHRISKLSDRIPLRRPEDRARLEEGLRLAGLPE
jgi:TolB-like protein/tetratricopeptide (TPR) repeat protein